MTPKFNVRDVVRLKVLNMIGRVDYVSGSHPNIRYGVKTPGNAFSVEENDIELVNETHAMIYLLENA